MTIAYVGANRIQGLSTDTKPTTVPAGCKFEETDTFVDWRFNGTTWVVMTGCFNPNLTESLTNKDMRDATNITYKFTTFTTLVGAVATFSARYYMLWSGAAGNNALTEATVQLTFPYNILLTRLYGRATANTMSNATVFGFRDDATTAASISIPAASVATVDSGPISVTVAAGSLINWNIDTSASTTGSITPGTVCAIGYVY